MNINWIQKLKIAIASLALLGLTACGGAGGGGGSGVPSPATQAGIVVPVSMGGIAIVGQPYKGMVQVAPKDSTSTVTSLSIANNTAGGAQPSIDSAGNVVWIPNDQDFAASPASLRVTGQLSNGTTVADNVPMDVRKERVVLKTALTTAEQIYSDTQGNYIIQISKKTPTSVIAGDITITETYRKNGEFTWSMRGTRDTFTVNVLQAPATKFTPLVPANSATTQVGVATMPYPIDQLTSGYGAFYHISDDGSVLRSGSNVYSSRPAQPHQPLTYYDRDSIDPNIAYPNFVALNAFKAFWFGSNCASLRVEITPPGTPPDSLAAMLAGTRDCGLRAQTKSPIILIHGFSGKDNIAWNESIVGGDESTWGQTAQLLTDQGYPVFEMRWLSYMPFEDAAGALTKFGKDIAAMTGKKPIILAHSFGGIVSHLALQNKGREWKADVNGVEHWSAVKSDGVFAKLITLNS
ncbi:MAG: hypothetical protein WAO71_15785 [Gallionella sp.]